MLLPAVCGTCTFAKRQVSGLQLALTDVHLAETVGLRLLGIQFKKAEGFGENDFDRRRK